MKGKGFPNKMTSGQMGAYRGIQKAEHFRGGLNIRAGNEMGFRSSGRRDPPRRASTTNGC
jgi:hypothetical protein